MPGLVLLASEAASDRANIRSAQRDEALHIARLVAGFQASQFENYHAKLLTLAQLLGEPDGKAGCSAAARNMLREEKGLANLGVDDANGDVVCSGAPVAARVNVADREYFRRAMSTRAATLSEFLVARIGNVSASSWRCRT